MIPLLIDNQRLGCWLLIYWINTIDLTTCLTQLHYFPVFGVSTKLKISEIVTDNPNESEQYIIIIQLVIIIVLFTKKFKTCFDCTLKTVVAHPYHAFGNGYVNISFKRYVWIIVCLKASYKNSTQWSEWNRNNIILYFRLQRYRYNSQQ